MTPRILNDDIEKEHAEGGNEAKCEGRKKRKKKKKWYRRNIPESGKGKRTSVTLFADKASTY
jgi:hypothetical protein